LVGLVLLVALASPLPAEAREAQTAEPGPGAATFETVTSLDELTSDHARLFRLYWAFFVRQPDPAGALYWIGEHDGCVGLDSIADSFAGSDEFIDRYGHLDDRSFVEQIYRNVLDRPGDADGLTYWTDLLTQGVLSRGDVVLNVSLSEEFTSRHTYPSDGVPPRPCPLADGRPQGRSVAVLTSTQLASSPLATVAGLTLRAPATSIELAGFHQSSHPGALAMTPSESSAVRLTTMSSRNRGTDGRGAVDVATGPRTPIVAPVTGRVARAGNYTLYCRYQDGFVVINPDDRPDLEVKILHLQGVAVEAGQRVSAGDRIASSATSFPFRSQIDDLTAEPSWAHVHVEVVDPSVPRPGSGRRC
jgi:hypothetical protein